MQAINCPECGAYPWDIHHQSCSRQGVVLYRHTEKPTYIYYERKDGKVTKVNNY